MSELTHLDADGSVRMVNVSEKLVSRRMARASGIVRMQAETLAAILAGGVAKGPVQEVARLAGVMAAKRTAELIPLCHPVALESIAVEVEPVDGVGLRIEARVSATAKTGVEMEALVATSAAALTVYDMCKSMDRGMTVECIQLEEKSGGARGDFCRAASRSFNTPQT
ncbi:MAG TPA: cyclic pyranopterin monophosphate synthase MoaC [Lacipirellulaceae bacterium]|nr:cyclic pyranopterin monophosphate synthase MoaC [Lacipirellulaceae bacterium]